MLNKSMEYQDEVEEQSDRYLKENSKSGVLWGVIADFIINSNEFHFKKHIGIIDRTLHYNLDKEDGQLFSPKKNKNSSNRLLKSSFKSKRDNSRSNGSYGIDSLNRSRPSSNSSSSSRSQNFGAKKEDRVLFTLNK